MPRDDIVAECPKCGKHDFILGDNGEWICLNPECKFHEKTPVPEEEAQPTLDISTALLTALMVGIFMLAALGL
ncbi:hypothetical protein H6G89_08800 [Oscillatoria sp. FACHB-1407]|uniref:hypothetical protein n=1 Tax=Oscillatoria sp. FACHB-1407 TaxID=2692847 RepID=UPI001685215C|nr:hypothetical protein [Oscillatoria sp. FACHB-1407]MBD2461140.1 hypothetical protein [Oscillatoria sp. FACHB-1407]